MKTTSDSIKKPKKPEIIDWVKKRSKYTTHNGDAIGWYFDNEKETIQFILFSDALKATFVVNLDQKNKEILERLEEKLKNFLKDEKVKNTEEREKNDINRAYI